MSEEAKPTNKPTSQPKPDLPVAETVENIPYLTFSSETYGKKNGK